MVELLEVQDSFLKEGMGVIVSGVNPLFDEMCLEEIREFVGLEIIVEGENQVEAVLGIDAPISHSGRRIVMIALGRSVEIPRGRKLFREE